MKASEIRELTDEEVAEDKMKQGIRKYKLSFGGEVVNRYQYQKIYSSILKNIYKIKDIL